MVRKMSKMIAIKE